MCGWKMGLSHAAFGNEKLTKQKSFSHMGEGKQSGSLKSIYLQPKNKKFWLSFGILIVGLVSLIFFLTTPETPTIEKIGFTGLILSYIGLLLSLFFSSGFKRSFVLVLFGVIFAFAHKFYYGYYGPEILFYWIPGWVCLFLGCTHAIWTHTKSRRNVN